METLPEKTSRQLLTKCLEACEKTANKNSVALVRSFWEDEDVDDPRFAISLDAKLFTFAELEDKVLLFTLSPDATAQELLREFISWESKSIVPFACQRIVNLIGGLSTDDYKELMDLCETEGNQQAFDFFQEAYEESLPPAQVPEWVKDFGLTVEQETLEEEPLPSTESLLVELEKMEREYLEAILLLSSSTARKVLLGVKVEPEEQIKELEHFRKYGPSCLGERMFASEGVVQDFDDIDNTTAFGWFSGRCDECGKNIQGKECCLRQPREGGGWSGCYCSLDCLKVIDNSPRVDILAFQLNTFGIQKRNH